MMHYKTSLSHFQKEFPDKGDFFLAIELFLGYKPRLVLA
jgi:hypothetical protein